MPFDTKSYLSGRYQTIKKSGENSIQNYFYDKLHEVFNMPFINGDWLLDVGTGPCMHTTFYSSRKYKNIVLTDIDPSNRNELIKWLSNHPDAHNWRDFSNYVASKETSNDDEYIEERAKTAVRAVVPIDVHKSNPLDPLWFQKFDCIVTTLCLESACDSLISYNKALENLSTLIKKNGYLIVAGILEETYWALGDKKLSSCFLKIEDIKEKLDLNNFNVIYEDKLYFDRKNFETSDSKGFYIFVAQLR